MPRSAAYIFTTFLGFLAFTPGCAIEDLTALLQAGLNEYTVLKHVGVPNENVDGGKHKATELEHFVLAATLDNVAELPKEKSTKIEPGQEGDEGSELYFRPVSATVRCVMVLTITTVVLYTGLSASRNQDELSGTFRPSWITRTLTVTARGGALAPMFCMICLACRMFVLATTEGKGEPPDWAKTCMYIGSGGICAQYLLILFVGFVADHGVQDDGEAEYDMTEGKAAAAEAARLAKAAAKAIEADDEEEDEEHFEKTTGDLCDAHPQLVRARLGDGAASLRPAFWFGQVISMLAVYGGIGGVLACIFTFPVGTTQISVAVHCTFHLTELYFSVYLLLWVFRSLSSDKPWAQKALNACLSMSSVVRKAPMFAILFLMSRMRSLELDPPYGLPPAGMQHCFKMISVMLFLETLAAGMVGYFGVQEKAYYGVYIFRCEGRAMHLVQHCCALVSYYALNPIAAGAVAMKNDGREAPLSQTFACVLVLVWAYFGVMLGQTLVFALEDLLKRSWVILQDSFVAASISLSFSPLLCVLFVGTRMRALQITQHRGDPPGWAQDSMLLCTFATCIQAICCLVMPIFIGSACKVDDEGNPDYDLRPMIGAYAVTVVKYCSLMTLHGGIAAICICVFVMTPETANNDGKFLNGGAALLRGIATVLCLLLVALLLSSAKVIGMAVKMGIESVDRVFLGVDITIERAALGICKGYVNIRELKVHQPEEEVVYQTKKGKLVGKPTGKKLQWRNDFILKIKSLLVKINMWRLVKTLGREFELENLTFTGVYANVEKPSTNWKVKDSNIDCLLKHIEALAGKKPEKPADTDANAGAKSKKEEEESVRRKAEEAAGKEKEAEGTEEEDEGFVPTVILRKIALGDIGCHVTVERVPVIGTISFCPSIGKVAFDNVQEEVCDGKEDLKPQELVTCIVKALAKKITSVVVVGIPSQLAKASKDLAMRVAGSCACGSSEAGAAPKTEAAPRTVALPATEADPAAKVHGEPAKANPAAETQGDS